MSLGSQGSGGQGVGGQGVGGPEIQGVQGVLIPGGPGFHAVGGLGV